GADLAFLSQPARLARTAGKQGEKRWATGSQSWAPARSALTPGRIWCRPANVETMRAKGLKVSHIRDVPEWSVPVRALHLTELQQTSKEKPFDIAFVCMKSYDTEWATTMIAQYLSPNGFVVSLQ